MNQQEQRITISCYIRMGEYYRVHIVKEMQSEKLILYLNGQDLVGIFLRYPNPQLVDKTF